MKIVNLRFPSLLVTGIAFPVILTSNTIGCAAFQTNPESATKSISGSFVERASIFSEVLGLRPTRMLRRSPRLLALQNASFSPSHDFNGDVTSTDTIVDDSNRQTMNLEKPAPAAGRENALNTRMNSGKNNSVGQARRKSKQPCIRKEKTANERKKRTKVKAFEVDNSEENIDDETGTPSSTCLPRTIEQAVKSSKENSIQFVIGIDEAGRGPLAGPVVAAAVVAPFDLDGVVDSKKISKEDERERLYEQLISMDQIQWAVCVIDAQRIDDINILQATLEGMQMAAMAIVDPSNLSVPVEKNPSVDHKGCYVVVSSLPSPKLNPLNKIKHKRSLKDSHGRNRRRKGSVLAEASTASTTSFELKETPPTQARYSSRRHLFYALIDGNKIPQEMPCECHSIIKGDSKEFSVAAASILAKVTRDRLMRAYDQLYPEYNLRQHKGYPTAAHMKAVHENGASPIHRRTFAPLKYMQFDKAGKIIR